jgi:Zn-dependent oligopeptidase
MSNVVSQKEAVFTAITEVLGNFSGVAELSTEQRKEVISSIMSGFENGTVELSAEASTKYNTIAKLKSYTQGLVSNWLRKDSRLNGGVKHETKNPGSRAGSGDSTVKALRALRSTLKDANQIAEVESEIAARIAAFKASKTPKVEINTDLIPENLRHLVG